MFGAYNIYSFEQNIENTIELTFRDIYHCVRPKFLLVIVIQNQSYIRSLGFLHTWPLEALEDAGDKTCFLYYK